MVNELLWRYIHSITLFYPSDVFKKPMCITLWIDMHKKNQCQEIYFSKFLRLLFTRLTFCNLWNLQRFSLYTFLVTDYPQKTPSFSTLSTQSIHAILYVMRIKHLYIVFLPILLFSKTSFRKSNTYTNFRRMNFTKE